MVDVAFEKKGKMTKQELQIHMIREMNFFHPSSEEGPATSSRLAETASKNQVTSGVVAAVGSAAAADAAGAGAGVGAAPATATTEPDVVLSRTAEKDVEMERARKEAQRKAQEARGAAALANLARKADAGGSGSGSGTTAPADGDDCELPAATRDAIEAQFAAMEGVMLRRVTEHMQRLLAPIESRLAAMEAWQKTVESERR